MATIYIVESPSGVELRRGFKSIVTARKWAYANGNPFGDNKAIIASVGNGHKKYHGIMLLPGMFSREYVWIPENNPKNIRFSVKKDGTIKRL